MLLGFQWILFSKRPLNHLEYYYGVVSGLNPDWANNEWNSHDVTESDLNQFVLSSWKGLAEVSKYRPLVVQFIHESVRHFLLKDRGLYALALKLSTDLEADSQSASHEKLKELCLRHIKGDFGSGSPIIECLAVDFISRQYGSSSLFTSSISQRVSSNYLDRDVKDPPQGRGCIHTTLKPFICCSRPKLCAASGDNPPIRPKDQYRGRAASISTIRSLIQLSPGGRQSASTRRRSAGQSFR
jgi:hypothetical protein